MANDYTPRIAPLIPGCIGRAANLLAYGAVDQGDGTGAMLVQPTAASAMKILDASGVNQASVDSNGALLVELTGTQTTALSSATSTAAAALSCALPSSAGLVTWVTGFELTSGPVIAVVSGAFSIVGPSTTLNYVFSETVAAGGSLVVQFPDPIPASVASIPITFGLAAITGGAQTAINVHGFQR